jgi:predicted nucleic acid-binding protein
MAYRRKRITFDHIGGFLARLKALPIEAAQQAPFDTNYDAAYLALAIQFHLPLATTDSNLGIATASAGVNLVAI